MHPSTVNNLTGPLRLDYIPTAQLSLCVFCISECSVPDYCLCLEFSYDGMLWPQQCFILTDFSEIQISIS